MKEEFKNALKLLEQPMVVAPYRDCLTARALNKNSLNILYLLIIINRIALTILFVKNIRERCDSHIVGMECLSVFV